MTQRAPLVPHSAEHRAEAAPRGGAASNGALTRQPLLIGTGHRPARPGARGYASPMAKGGPTTPRQSRATFRGGKRDPTKPWQSRVTSLREKSDPTKPRQSRVTFRGGGGKRGPTEPRQSRVIFRGEAQVTRRNHVSRGSLSLVRKSDPTKPRRSRVTFLGEKK